MMNSLIQWLILFLLAIVLFTLVDPFMYWMPSMTQMISLSIAAALLAILAGIVLTEKSGDEREVIHRMQAGRAAFLSGIGILTVALLYQGATHAVDPWVPLALFGMVFAKLCARFYSGQVN